MSLPRLALRLTSTAAAFTVLLAAVLVASSPASAAATYTFYASGSAVGTTAPGVAKDYTLNLTNLNASSSISFNLAIAASPVGWTAQLSQTSLTVAASSTQQVTLTVRPPSTALADSVGQYVNVTATPDDNTTAQTVATTTRVTEVFGVAVTLIPQGGTSGDPGQNITWLGYIQNTGNSPQTYTVNVNNTSFTSTNLTTNLVTVSPGDTRVVQVTVNISATAPVGVLYSRITATSNANSSVTDSEEFAATVNAKRAVGLFGLTPDDLRASTESESAVTLRNIIVENRGNVADAYTLLGTANASRHGEWVSFPSSTLALPAFTQRYLNVTVTVPASVTQTGDYTVEFRIISDNSTAVIAFLNLTITITAKHDLSLVYESLVARQSGEPGTVVAFPVNVSNPGAFDERVDLSYVGANSGWVAISATPFTLAPGAYRIVYYNFTIPGTQVPTSFAFQAAGTINWSAPYRNRTVDLTLEVSQVFDVIATSSVGALAGNPGSSVTFTVTVRNNGTGLDNFTVAATNTTQAGLVTLSSSTLSLATGGTGNVTVTVAVTSLPAPAAGVYYYGVTVRSSGNASRLSTVTLALTVNQTFALQATVTPSYQAADPGATASYTVSVTNNGNGPDGVTLQKAGLNQSWVTFPTGNGTVAAGARRNFTVQVTTPSWAPEGATLLQVTAVSDGDGNATALSSFTLFLNPRRSLALELSATDLPNSHRNGAYSIAVTVRNSGNLADTYALSISGADANWATLPFANVTLAPNENLTFTLPIALPADPSNGAHAFTVRATSLANTSLEAAATFTVTVNDILRPEVRLTTTSYFAQPSANVNIAFIVRNNGTIPDTITLTATAHFPVLQGFSQNYTLNALASASGTFVVQASYPYSGVYLVDFRAVSLTNSSFEGWAFANITLEVTRAVDLSAVGQQDTTSGGPGDTRSFTLTVQNRGNITDTYAMVDQTHPSGWTVTFSQDNFTLTPGASTNVSVSLQAPPTLLESLTGYAFGIEVRSQTVPAIGAALTLRFQVSFDQSLTPTLQDKALLPGSMETFTVVVKNEGTAADQFLLSPTGQVASWVSVDQPVLDLAANASATVTLTVFVPIGTHDGVKGFSLQSDSGATAEFKAVAFTVTVLKVYAFAVSAPTTPVLVSPGQTASFLFSVINTGNTNDSYSFVATPQQFVSFQPAGGTIDALQVLNVTVLITPSANASAGPMPVSITVYGSAGNTQVVTVSTTVRQVYNVTAAGLPGGTFTGAGAPGGEVQFSFNITNRGNGDDVLNWTLSGEAAPWALQGAGSLSLASGRVAIVNVILRIPTDPLLALAGPRTLNVTVVSQGGGAAVRAAIAGSLEVSQAAGFTFSLDPETLVTSNVTSHDLADQRPVELTVFVRNTGNRAETVTISRTPIAGWTVAILIGGSPGSQLTLAPGEQKSAVVRIATFPAGAQDDTLRVSARSVDGAAPTADLSVRVEFLQADVRVDPPQLAITATSVAIGGSVSVTFTVKNFGTGTATGVQVELVIDGQQHVDQKTLSPIAPGGSTEVSLTWSVDSSYAGRTHTIGVEIVGGNAYQATEGVTVGAKAQEGLLAKITGDQTTQLVLILGLVVGLVIGLAARGAGRRKPAPAFPMPQGPRAPPPGSPESALAGLEALEAEGTGGAPPAPPGAEGPGVEHKIVCPNCGTEQWIRGAEGECTSCGVVIEVSEEEESPPAPEGGQGV